MRRFLALLVVIAILAAGIWVSPNGTVRGGLAVLLLFTVVGTAIAWLAGATARMSSSGREMGETTITTSISDDGTPHGHH